MQARVNPNERANQTLTPPDPSKTYFRLVPKGEAPPRVGQWVENALPYEGSSAALGFVTFDLARHWSSGASAFVVECEGDGMAVYRGTSQFAHIGRMASDYDPVPTGFIYPSVKFIRAATEAELNEHGVYTTGTHNNALPELKAIATDGTAKVYGRSSALESVFAFGDSDVWARHCEVHAHDRSRVCVHGGSVYADGQTIITCMDGAKVQASGMCRVVGTGTITVHGEVWAHIDEDGVLYIKDAFSGPRTSGVYTRSDRGIIVDQRSGGNVAYGQGDGIDGWRFDRSKKGDERWSRVSAPKLSVVPDVTPANQTETKAVAAAVQVPVAASTAAPTVLDDIVRLAVQVREAETALAASRTRLSDAIAAMSAPAAPVATLAPAEPAPAAAVPQEVVHAPARKGPRVTVTHPPRSAKSR